MAAGSITFTFGSTAITLPVPPSASPNNTLEQRVMRSARGRVVCVSLDGEVRRRPRLRFTDIDEQMAGDLQDFLVNVADGSANVFVYNDRHDTNYNVRYVAGLPIRKVGTDQFQIDLQLSVA